MAYEKKIVDLTEQSSSYYKYINNVVGIMLAPDDIISIRRCKKILTANPQIHNALTFGKPESKSREDNAVKMIQLVCNCVSIYYQYMFPGTWFTYFLTTFSGMKKIYHFIFQNPIYGLLFYSTFYFKILDTYDKDKFNQISTALNLPKHEDAMSNKFLDAIVVNSSKYMEVSIEYKNEVETFMKGVASAVISTAGQKSLEKVFVNVLQDTKSIKYTAIYIPERDRFDFDDTVIQDQLEMLRKNRSNIKAFMRQQGVKLKKKQLKKKAFLQIAQLKDPEGNVICLDQCKSRVKTRLGCYCEGDCGPTTFLGGKNWCWVDKTKCKKGKSLEKGFRGKAYDLCNPIMVDPTKKCFTGLGYTECNK